MKRIVLDLKDTQHAEIKRRAIKANQTIANYLRELLGFPSERQGSRSDLKTPKKRKKKD